VLNFFVADQGPDYGHCELVACTLVLTNWPSGQCHLTLANAQHQRAQFPVLTVPLPLTGYCV
jgi:hypothetical protein